MLTLRVLAKKQARWKGQGLLPLPHPPTSEASKLASHGSCGNPWKMETDRRGPLLYHSALQEPGGNASIPSRMRKSIKEKPENYTCHWDTSWESLFIRSIYIYINTSWIWMNSLMVQSRKHSRMEAMYCNGGLVHVSRWFLGFQSHSFWGSKLDHFPQ